MTHSICNSNSAFFQNLQLKQEKIFFSDKTFIVKGDVAYFKGDYIVICICIEIDINIGRDRQKKRRNSKKLHKIDFIL